ncbi:sensor histidine kinase [Dactylosporangium sp. McL0621]|uniref:sensor histidine kinase n=1 Tax=Dactylosporangium sp. McL0621 TaxID=3415678 RepID=UPI003CF289C7
MRRRIRAHIGDIGSIGIGALLGAAALPLLVLLVIAGPASLVGGLGLALFAGVAWTSRRVAGVQRRRLARDLDREPLPPYRTGPDRAAAAAGPVGRAFARLGVVAADPQTWRDFAWLLVQLPLGIGSLVVVVALWLQALQCIAAPLLLALLPRPAGFDPVVLELTGRSAPGVWLLVPLGVASALLTPLVARWLVALQRRLGARLLGPRTRDVLDARLRRVTAARTDIADASAAELRRIERDLHDGAQARLISVAMSLGVAEDVIDDNPAGAKAMLAEARADAGAALTELRSLVRGIHPPVLSDRGLNGAIQALVLGSRLPVDLDIRLERRLKPPVEAAAYFAIAESLVNAIRHSGARRVRISVEDRGRRLAMTVSDDGRGGAEPERGTGLLGIRRRLSAFDGSLSVVSPPGGPTVLDMELPCGS